MKIVLSDLKYMKYSLKANCSRVESIGNNEDFLQLCDYFDIYVMRSGMGSFRRAGIIAICEKYLQ